MKLILIYYMYLTWRHFKGTFLLGHPVDFVQHSDAEPKLGIRLILMAMRVSAKKKCQETSAVFVNPSVNEHILQ